MRKPSNSSPYLAVTKCSPKSQKEQHHNRLNHCVLNDIWHEIDGLNRQKAGCVSPFNIFANKMNAII